MVKFHESDIGGWVQLWHEIPNESLEAFLFWGHLELPVFEFLDTKAAPVQREVLPCHSCKFRLDKKTSLWGLCIEDIGATVIAVGKCTDANKFPACQARSKFRWKWKKRLALVSGQQPMVCWCLWGIFEAPDNRTFFQGSALDDYKRSAARWDSAQSELCPKAQNKVWDNCYNCVV